MLSDNRTVGTPVEQDWSYTRSTGQAPVNVATSTADPPGRVASYTYDVNGNVASRTFLVESGTATESRVYGVDWSAPQE